MADSSEGTCGC